MRRRATWLVAAVATCLVAGVYWWLRSQPLAQLIAAAPTDARYIKARLSGAFPWAPLADTTRSGDRSDINHMQLIGAAARTLKKVSTRPTSDARQAEGLAHLLSGHAEIAIESLSAIPERERDAAMWSDLAAAHHVLAVRTGSPDHLKEALIAVDQGIRLDGASKEALFNRALVLEEFQLLDAAIDAWRDYLAVESDGDWANEARQRLGMLERSRVSSPQEEIERSYGRLERGERSTAEKLVQIDPGEVRYFFQTEGLGRWGEAWLSGNSAAADRHLAAARTVGVALLARNGEPMLADSVAVIEHADHARTDALARGHVAFRQGRIVYRKQKNYTAAEPILAAAARDLATGGSPMAADARVFTAVAVFWQQRQGEAEKEFEAVRKSAPSKYAALHGYVQWQLANAYMIRAQWGDSIVHLNRAIEVFNSLGERDNEGYLRDILSQVYDAIGDRERAGFHRAAALRQLGRTTNYRLEHVLVGMVHDALKHKEWRAAMSFLNVEFHIARHVQDKELQTVILLRRALVFSRSGDAGAADRDLTVAATVIAAVDDPALKKKLQVDHAAAVALLSSRPETAIRLLSDVLRFHDAQGWRMLMPDLYLRRGRMYLAVGDRDRAAADFEAGILELEHHRESLPKGEARWGVFDAADELFEEALTMAIRSDTRRAFEYAERARARSLADAIPADERPFDPSNIPADTVLLEYSVLPRKLVIIAVDSRGYRLHEKEIEREKLSTLLDELVNAFASDEASRGRALSHAAYDMLIAPVAGELGSHREIVFIPDAATSAVPFAALIDPQGKWLIEHHPVSVAPSARLYLRARQRFSGSPRTTALIVDSPANEELEPLDFAAREADAISAEYPKVSRLSGRAATNSAVIDAMQHAEVIHFAVHGETTAASSMLMLSSASDSPALDHAAIARLHLPRASIVVLGACASASGPMRRGEGQLSIAHAFLQAGAPAVIATLWPISDRDSAAFFPLLHRELARGLSATEALRRAQLEYIRESPADRASLWAAVQAIGY